MLTLRSGCGELAVAVSLAVLAVAGWLAGWRATADVAGWLGLAWLGVAG